MVVSDTSPINYLVLVGQIDVRRAEAEQVFQEAEKHRQALESVLAKEPT